MANHAQRVLTAQAPSPQPGVRILPAYLAQTPVVTTFFLGFQLIREIGNGYTERLRVVVGAMTGALLRAQRACEMVIRVSNVGAVLRFQRNLEEVRKGTAVAIDNPCCRCKRFPRG